MHFNIFFICFIINIFFSTQNLEIFDVTINPTDTDLGGLYIKDQTEKPICTQWLPSLFSPILLIPNDKDKSSINPIPELDFKLKTPVFLKNNEFDVEVYNSIQFLNKNYKSIFIVPAYENLKNCYFGISPGINNFGNLEEKNVILNVLKNDNSIEKIFSFDIWDIKALKTTFYFGESHNTFNSNTGIIGNCKNYPKDSLWGCSFKEMLFNNFSISLKKVMKAYIEFILPVKFTI